MRLAPTILAIAALGLLAGCGHSEPDRTAGGAATGAATGAAVGALGGPPGMAAGAAIGAAAGGATGAATSPNSVNLGEPPWHRGAPSVGQNIARDVNK